MRPIGSIRGLIWRPGCDRSAIDPTAEEGRLTGWPGGEERLLARVGYHGDPVRLAR